MSPCQSYDLHAADRAASSLQLPPSRFVRDADQRAAFGRFCIGASALLLPRKIERRDAGKFQISYFRRRLFGADLPIVYALAEQDAAAGRTNVAEAAEAVGLSFADEPRADIIRIYVAGSHGGQKSTSVDDKYNGVYFPLQIPEAIELGDDLEGFLRSLGNHTRRDMRRLRRKADEQKLAFEFQAATPAGARERRRLGLANNPMPYRARQIESADCFVAAQGSGFHALLRSASGELLSCCTGFVADRCAIVLYQINHGAYPKASLSLSLRSFLVEALIGRGISEIVFPGSVNGLLVAACRVREGGEFVLMRRTAAAAIEGAAIMLARPSSRIGMAFRRIAGARLTARSEPQTRILNL